MYGIQTRTLRSCHAAFYMRQQYVRSRLFNTTGFN